MKTEKVKKFIQRLSLILAFISTISFFGFITFYVSKLTSQEIKLEEILLDHEKRICKAFFSPDDPIRDILVALINAEKKSIVAAIYTFTEKNIAKAFIDAQARGVKIEFVVDRSYGADKFSKVPQLANNHVPVWVYQTCEDSRASSLMHHKFCIFQENILNKPIIITGSFNYTQRASTANQENVIILDCPEVIDRFKNQFNILKSRSLLISGKPGDIYKQIECNQEQEVSGFEKIKKWFLDLFS